MSETPLSGRAFDALLAELGPVAWSTMKHCRGDASDVPALLRKWLTSRDADTSTQARGKLWDALQYQGSIFEPSAYATQLVAAALPDVSEAKAAELVPFIARMARGYTMTEGQGLLRWVPEDSEERPAVEQQYQRELGWVRDVQRAAWCAYDELVRRLRGDERRSMQLYLPFALKGLLVDAADGCPESSKLVELGGAVSAILWARVGSTKDDLLRAGYAFALGALQELVPSNVDALEANLGKHGEAFAAVSALGLVRSRPGPAIADALAHALRLRDEHQNWFPMEPYCPWLGGHLRFQLVSALGYGPLADADFDRALPALLDLLRTTANCHTADYDLAPVLYRVFGEKKLPEGATRASLDERQAAVLQALYDNAELWDPSSGNLMLVMRRIGLDNDRELVGELL